MIHDILQFLEPTVLIKAVGFLGIIAIVFAESGLFFGFFLPGDSLLFTAGFLASTGLFPLLPLLIFTFIAAIAGDSVGYWFGRTVGPKIFTREDSIFFHKKHIERAQKFYERYGNKTIFLARFVPIVRTFAPIVAGVGKMKYSNFITYNIVGGFVWAFSMILLGFFLGTVIPGVDKYLLPIILVIIFISFIPVIREYWIHKKMMKK